MQHLFVNDSIANQEKNIYQFSNYYNSLPEKPYYSNTKRFQPDLFANKEFAILHPYIQHNHPNYIKMFSLDLDYENSVYAFENNNLCEPSIVAVNQENGHSEYTYILNDGIPWQKASNKTKKALKEITYTLKETLCADKLKIRQKLLCKNAMHGRWDVAVYGKELSLSDIAMNLPTIKKAREYKRISTIRDFGHYVGIGRNVTMFDYIRHFAYSIVHEHKDLEAFRWLLVQEIKSRQGDLCLYFPAPLPSNEVHSIARSVSRWCFKNKENIRNSLKKNIGVMGFKSRKGAWIEPEIFNKETKARQSAGALYKNKNRASMTEIAILQALYLAEGTGQPITLKLIANMVGCTLRTIYSYRHLLPV